ncbi:recombinase family protein [Paenibacillus sp. V4I9]|uniref:recombinase family protein n=1 Tax=Paenibacillus sp. V4I9 TaxID=3042308 RepID=UPI0027D80519|nr:recombinase family protein [Paenibacillus sp. V4I9]
MHLPNQVSKIILELLINLCYYSTAAGKALFSMLAVFAEFERNIIVERTKAGLAASRARGRNGGRPKTDTKKVIQAIKLYDSKAHSVADKT